MDFDFRLLFVGLLIGFLLFGVFLFGAKFACSRGGGELFKPFVCSGFDVVGVCDFDGVLFVPPVDDVIVFNVSSVNWSASIP